MQRSAEIGALAEALAKAQGEFVNPSRNREVTVRTKTGGSYKFSYATFDAILDVIRKPLANNGLSFVQGVSEGKLVTTLMHASGQWLETVTPILVKQDGNDANQALGSAITYAKRYALTAILGVAADEDDDANSADGNTIMEQTDRAPAPVRQARPANVPPPPAKEMTAADWCAAAIGTVKTFKTTEQIGKWQSANSRAIDKLERQAPELYARLMDAINECLDAAQNPLAAA